MCSDTLNITMIVLYGFKLKINMLPTWINRHFRYSTCLSQVVGPQKMSSWKISVLGHHFLHVFCTIDVNMDILTPIDIDYLM